MNKKGTQGFTLIELLVVIAIIATLAALLLPVLNHAKQSAQGIQCLNNVRQTTISWKMYNDDNRGNFPINTSESQIQRASQDWITGVLSWKQNNPDNTNYIKLTNGLVGPYFKNQFKIFKCPADVYSCQENGTPMDRVRSISMNGYIGQVDGVYNAYYAKIYNKESDVITPAPSSLWVIVDEQPDSINDGFFIYNYSAYGGFFVDTPGNYHNGGCNFSFADGHGEPHHWIEQSYWWNPPYCNTNTPYVPPQESPYGVDILWMNEHTTYHN